MTYSYTEDRLVKIESSWIRVSAIQAVVRIGGGRTGIWLSSGHRIDVGDINGSISPDDVVNGLARRADG